MTDRERGAPGGDGPGVSTRPGTAADPAPPAARLAVAFYPDRLAQARHTKARTPSEALRLPDDPGRSALAASTARAVPACPSGPPPDAAGTPPAGEPAAPVPAPPPPAAAAPAVAPVPPPPRPQAAGAPGGPAESRAPGPRTGWQPSWWRRLLDLFRR